MTLARLTIVEHESDGLELYLEFCPCRLAANLELTSVRLWDLGQTLFAAATRAKSEPPTLLSTRGPLGWLAGWLSGCLIAVTRESELWGPAP